MTGCKTGGNKKKKVCPGKEKMLRSLRTLILYNPAEAVRYIDGALDGKTHDELMGELRSEK